MIESNREQSPELMIARVQSFDELFIVLDQLGQIPATDGKNFYTADALKKIIQGVRKGMWDKGVLTDSYGIRSKVEELLKTDKLKRAKRSK